MGATVANNVSSSIEFVRSLGGYHVYIYILYIYYIYIYYIYTIYTIYIYIYYIYILYIYGTPPCAYIFLFWLLNSSVFLVQQTILEGLAQI